MSYKVEEPNEEPIFYNESNEEIECYYKLYSSKQKKRFKSVLKQMMSIWYDVYHSIKMIRDYTGSENTDIIMLKVHKVYLNTLFDKIDYYNEEKIRKRKNKEFIKKKINKLKNKITPV